MLHAKDQGEEEDEPPQVGKQLQDQLAQSKRKRKCFVVKIVEDSLERNTSLSNCVIDISDFLEIIDHSGPWRTFRGIKSRDIMK